MAQPSTGGFFPTPERIDAGIDAIRVVYEQQKVQLAQKRAQLEMMNRVCEEPRREEAQLQNAMGLPQLRNGMLVLMDIEFQYVRGEIEHREPHLAWWKTAIKDIETQWAGLSMEEKKQPKELVRFWNWIQEIKQICDDQWEATRARARATRAMYGPDGPPQFDSAGDEGAF